MRIKQLIERISKRHPIPEGSRPADITTEQHRATCLCARLYLYADKRGQRKKGKWI